MVPQFLRDEMRKAIAFSRLRLAAQALLDENTEVANSSYRDAHADKLTDEMWRREDINNFKLCREVRNALREAARCFPDASVSAKETKA